MRCVLKGDIPSVNDGEVTVQACTVGLDGSACYHGYDIDVKNCAAGDYRVYHLQAPDSCPEAYCVGT